MALPPRAHRPTRLRLTVATTGAALVVASLLTPAAAHASHGSLKHRQRHLHHRVHTTRLDFDDSSHALVLASRRLAEAQRRLASARSVLASTKVQLTAAATAESAAAAKLTRARTALATAQQAVADARAAVAEQRREIGVFAAQSYTYGDPQLASLAAMFGGGSPIEVSTQLTAADSVMSKQDATLETLQTDEAALAEARAIAAGAEQQVAAEEQAAAATLDRKQALEHTAATQEHAVAALVRSRRTDKVHAANAKRADLRKLHRLMRHEARIKRRILAEARHQRSRWVGSTGGILEAPVHGPITSPFGYRFNPIYHYWGLHNGDDFGVACGTPAHAAGTGRIISEYYSSVWGNRLYLDLGNVNGHNFTVIYNHLSAYRMHTGSRVRRGTVVAYTGTTGWSTGCHLHFTVMRDGVAVNPMSYIG